MADLTSNIVANAVFRIGATPTLELNNTGTFPAGVIYKKSVLLPNGAIRTATGASAVIQLGLALDGTTQTGLYVITETVNDGVQDSSLIRSFTLTLDGLSPVLTVAEDYTAPGFVFTDKQTYGMVGYTTQSIIRSWSAMRGLVVAASYTGTSPVFDIAQSGVYYQSQYTVKEAAVVTYQRSTAPWASVVVTYTMTQMFSPKLFPTIRQMLDWSDDDADCGCEDGNQSDCLRKAVTDFYCAGNFNQAFIRVNRLFKENHDKAAYRPLYNDQALQGVTYCTGVTLPLVITTQPMGGTLVAGVLQLAIVVSGGTTPYTYQWYKGGVVVTGATGASFTATTQGTYYVVATDATGTTVTSANADVTVVITLFQITQNPQDQSVNAGTNASFSAAYSGGVIPVNVEWRENGVPIDGSTNPSALTNNLVLNNVQIGQSGNLYDYRAIDNLNNIILSNAATLTVQSVIALKARIGFAPNGIDPYVNGTTAPDNITYLPYLTIINANDAITIARTNTDYAKLADNYIVLEMVTGIGDRTLVANGGFGPYTIPAQEFARSAVTSGLKYIVSNNPWTLSLNDDLVFTH